MAIKPRIGAHRPFQIDALASGHVAKPRAIDGFAHRIERDFVALKLGHGQTGSIERNAVA
jgi:hypothetical protein